MTAGPFDLVKIGFKIKGFPLSITQEIIAIESTISANYLHTFATVITKVLSTLRSMT